MSIFALNVGAPPSILFRKISYANDSNASNLYGGTLSVDDFSCS